ncbi:hypothetical protein PV383_43975 [Streptomyces caniscabiei]|uniref:Lipoprotein n=1 Tax=Streptomyces caniscabiei TaxID=2746961 RepID=A0ABU4N2S4_9ACTN|nr:hypothetical protein [Streptomyces caniscabiei]MDX3044073.1 hypothetical protein [Streptomyces caniscabiei]
MSAHDAALIAAGTGLGACLSLLAAVIGGLLSDRKTAAAAQPKD